MTNAMKQALESVVKPLLRRPKRLQIAALCYRETGPRKEVLLITSRGTGRWILPKGWPINGLDAGQAALQEAWEEAGVRKGSVESRAIGTYTYDKALDEGWSIEIETLVYPVEVEAIREKFPEAHQRKRTWVDPSEAANMVREPELQSILRDL